jgi:glycosyltransferase involved in cell wall biosynthesis
MKLAVNISTYRRKDGKSKDFLKRTLESIKKQKHQDYKVFLIGDKYEDNEEFLEICTSILDPSKIYYENLPFAYERDKYLDLEQIWSSGGTYSTNYAIEKALEEGFEWVCHIDHDDIWEENHLLNFSNFIESNPSNFVFLASRCDYLGKYIVPCQSPPGIFYPTPSDLAHSSVCINFSKIPLRYRDVYEETGKIYAADADLWERITEYIKENGLSAYLVEEATLIYDKMEKL